MVKATPLPIEKVRELATLLLLMPGQDGADFGIRPVDIKREIVSAISTFANSTAHADRAVLALKNELKFRPTWADIRQAFERTAAVAVAEKPICQVCQGSGRVTQWWLLALRVGRYRQTRLLGTLETGFNDEKARDVMSTMADDEDVLTFGARCMCTPPLLAE